MEAKRQLTSNFQILKEKKKSTQGVCNKQNYFPKRKAK